MRVLHLEPVVYCMYNEIWLDLIRCKMAISNKLETSAELRAQVVA